MSKVKPDKMQKFAMAGCETAAEPFPYKGCGLDNIFLMNGFEHHKTAYGEGVSIANLEELHRAIGLTLIRKAGPLSAQEFRFLRSDLGLTQARFAELLNSEEQNVGRYERGEFEISGPVDKLARTVYFLITCPDDVFDEFFEDLTVRQQKSATNTSQMFERKNDHWQNSRQAIC